MLVKSLHRTIRRADNRMSLPVMSFLRERGLADFVPVYFLLSGFRLPCAKMLQGSLSFRTV